MKTFYKNNKEIIFAGLIFLVMLIILFLTPINGDDWGNYPVGKLSPWSWFSYALGMYFDWEGRFVSRVLINALTANKWLWNILTALSMAILYLFTMKILAPRNKVIASIVCILGILLIGNEIFNQTYLWIAGNLTYFTPMVLLIIYFYLIKCHIDKKIKSNYIYSIWILLNLTIPMFVENAGAVIVITNVILIIYQRIINKKWDKLFIVSLIISLSAFLLMVFSPGTKYRLSVDSADFNNLPLLDKIIINIPNFILYTIASNNIILFFIPISFVYLVCKKTKNINFIKLSVIFNIIPYIVLIFNIINILPVNIIPALKNLNFLCEMNLGMIIYWIVYLLIFFILIILNYKNNHMLIFIFVIGLISNGVMLVSPIWGGRTTLFTVYTLLMTNVFILSELKIKYEKTINVIGMSAIALTSVLYLILYVNVYKQNIDRVVMINEQLNNGSDIIEVEQIPDYALWGINPYDEFHIRTFKEYYNIPQEKELIITPYDYKYFLFYK